MAYPIPTTRKTTIFSVVKQVQIKEKTEKKRSSPGQQKKRKKNVSRKKRKKNDVKNVQLVSFFPRAKNEKNVFSGS